VCGKGVVFATAVPFDYSSMPCQGGRVDDQAATVERNADGDGGSVFRPTVESNTAAMPFRNRAYCAFVRMRFPELICDKYCNRCDN
jgi:hypothetical protein